MNTRKLGMPFKQVTALFLTACLCFSTTGVGATGQRGADIQVNMKNGTRVTGELIQVYDGGLLRLLDPSNQSPVVVALNEARSLKIIKKSSLLRGVGLGALIGAGLGGGTAAIAAPSSGFMSGKAQWAAAGALVIGALGALIGAASEALRGANESVTLTGRTPMELTEIVVKLARYARIPTIANAAETTPAGGSTDGRSSQTAQPQDGPSDWPAAGATVVPLVDTAPSATPFHRFHVSFGVNYVRSEAGPGIEDVIRAAGFDHSRKSCFFSCVTTTYPRVDRATRLVAPDIRLDYSLNRTWAVGLNYSPVGTHEVAGYKEIAGVDYRSTYPATTELVARHEGHAFALTASLFPIPDAFLRKTTVQLSVGAGIARITSTLKAGPYAEYSSSVASLDGQNTVQETQKTVPVLRAGADVVYFFNNSLSLNAGVQYRYIPFSAGPQTISAPYSYYPAAPPQGTLTWGATSVAIPARTVNAGGIGVGVGFGFHF